MYELDNAPLTWRHIRVVFVASLGQILGMALSTLVGIIIPLIQLFGHPELSSVQQGLLASTSLLGISFGSVIFGKLSDKFGYLFFFRLCPLMALAASLIAWYCDSLLVLVSCLFAIGMSVGGEYSLDSDYISEIVPSRWKDVLVGAAKAASGLGNIGIAAACYFILLKKPYPEAWNSLLLTISVLTFFTFLLRISFAQSPGWLISQGRYDEAIKSVRYFLGDNISIQKAIDKNEELKKQSQVPKEDSVNSPFFCRQNFSRIALTSIPWACEGLGVYGIGTFLPILVMALGLEPSISAHASEYVRFEHIEDSILITLLISAFILPGFALGLWLINKVSIIKLQGLSFILCGCGLVILLLGSLLKLPIWISILGFIIFELFLNAGPNLCTYVLPSLVFPVSVRGVGSGFAAAVGKFGAFLAVFFVPVLLDCGGMTAVLIVSIIIQILGASTTLYYGRVVNREMQKTTGKTVF